MFFLSASRPSPCLALAVRRLDGSELREAMLPPWKERGLPDAAFLSFLFARPTSFPHFSRTGDQMLHEPPEAALPHTNKWQASTQRSTQTQRPHRVAQRGEDPCEQILEPGGKGSKDSDVSGKTNSKL